MLLSIAAALIYILTDSAQGFYLPKSFQHLLFPVVVYSNHSDGCVVKERS